MVGVLLMMASQNFSNSNLIAFVSGTGGFDTEMVFLPPSGVSRSNEKTSISGPVLSLITSVFLFRKSIPIYASFWNKRILRIFFIEMRLDVRLATQPLLNSIRTFAISGVSVITATPFEEMAFT